MTTPRPCGARAAARGVEDAERPGVQRRREHASGGELHVVRPDRNARRRAAGARSARRRRAASRRRRSSRTRGRRGTSRAAARRRRRACGPPPRRRRRSSAPRPPSPSTRPVGEKPTSCAGNGGRTRPRSRGRRGSETSTTASSGDAVPSPTQSVRPSRESERCRGQSRSFSRATTVPRTTSTVTSSALPESVTNACRPSRRGRRVARLDEAVEHVAHREPAHDADLADRRVRDDGTRADALDAARPRPRRDALAHEPGREVDGDDVRLRVGGDERDRKRRAARRAPPPRRERKRACPCRRYVRRALRVRLAEELVDGVEERRRRARRVTAPRPAPARAAAGRGGDARSGGR